MDASLEENGRQLALLREELEECKKETGVGIDVRQDSHANRIRVLQSKVGCLTGYKFVWFLLMPRGWCILNGHNFSLSKIWSREFLFLAGIIQSVFSTPCITL